MSLKELQESWEEWARKDPMWTIAPLPSKFGNKWTYKEFFDSGQKEVEKLINYLGRFNLPKRRLTALDFGCGIGRLTQALTDHFYRVIGVDFTPSFIEKAEEVNLNRHRCKYILNEKEDLSRFVDGAFDFIVSLYVLQHMPVKFAWKYLEEFVRILDDDGIIVFQLPSEPRISFRKRLGRILPRRQPELPKLIGHQMNCTKCEEMLRFLDDLDVNVVDIIEDGRGGRDFVSYQYTITKCVQRSIPNTKVEK